MDLSICMIVKDEEKNLKQNLDSLNGLVSEGAELIIVDTGSFDGTLGVAKNFTDKVFEYEWRDDFSDARNFSISKATKKWIMVIDADERFSSTPSILKSYLNEAEKISANSLQVLIKNYLNVQTFNVDKQLRVFRHNSALYKNIVHNQLHFLQPQKTLKTNVVFDHFGYVDQSVLLKKRKRTIKLILESMKFEKENLYLIQQLARAYFGLKDYNNSFKYSNMICERILSKSIKVKPNNLFFLESLVIAAKSLFEIGKEDTLIETYYLAALKIFPKYIDALILLAEFYYSVGKVEKSKALLIKYLIHHDELLSNINKLSLPPCNTFGMKLNAMRFLIIVLRQLNNLKSFQPFVDSYLKIENNNDRREEIRSLFRF